VGGLPAIVMPAGFSPGGLPIAIELMGRRYDDATLIAMAAGWEAHTNHRMLPPTTPGLASP
jgi:amidase